MRALVLDAADAPNPQLLDVDEAALPPGDVLIDVAYSSLNYKDGLAVTGQGKIVRGGFPFVPGIDLAGTVAESQSEAFAPGDRVILTGWGTGEERWGGYAERARADAGHLVRLPEGLALRDAMAFGTAGFTAMLALMALEAASVRPGEGEVVVTGATGGVGSVAVALLAAAGYEAVASTGSPDKADYLGALGATRVIGRDELGNGPARPLDTGRWAGAIDSVGGPTLAAILSQTRRHGAVAACGLAASAELHTTVYPFILRGIALLGIDSNTCPPLRRADAWARLAQAHAALDALEQTAIPLEEVPAWAERIVRGETTGRVVVEVGGEPAA